MDSVLTFEEESHTYRYGGKVVPSVTQVMEPLYEYDGIPIKTLQIAADRGNAVHKATELLDWGMLDRASLEAEWVPYVEAYEKFLLETGFEVELIEERVFHAKSQYAGTVDRIGILKKRTKKHKIILDIKTTAKLMRGVGPQTAAYQDAFNQNTSDKALLRYALQLKKDGTFVFEEQKNKQDLTVFKSCLNIYNWRNR